MPNVQKLLEHKYTSEYLFMRVHEGITQERFDILLKKYVAHQNEKLDIVSVLTNGWMKS